MKTLELEFEQMVRKHRGSIYTVCFMFSKDSDEVNDLFQEVLINLWKRFPAFKGESKVDTWIWRVSFNTCISHKHKKNLTSEVYGRNRLENTRISRELKKKFTANIPLELSIDLFHDKDEDTRQIQMLYQRFRQLDPIDRAIVLLWLEGMPYDEIVTIVGSTVKNVSERLFRVNEELKKMSNH
jgi:RNA polymerase sigma-70 factor (ECF subfamily)